MNLTFHVKHNTGATFTYVHKLRSEVLIGYYISQFRKDPSVERVLVSFN